MFNRMWNRFYSFFQYEEVHHTDNSIALISRIDTVQHNASGISLEQVLARSSNLGVNPYTGELLPRGTFYRRRPNANVGTIGHVDAGFTQSRGRPRFYLERNENSLDADTTSTTELSQELQAFIKTRKNAEKLNENLSQQFNARDQYLFCPILQDFPQIPVRFNGRLYDYDSLIQSERGGFISDPVTREKIQLTSHVIQPDYDAQMRMDELHLRLDQTISNRK